MEFDALNKMCSWELKKALYLITVAEELGMDLSGTGHVGVNYSSGYTYLWLEEYDFTLYMTINCELVKKDITVSWTNPDTGEEVERAFAEENKPTTLKDLLTWAERFIDVGSSTKEA